MLLKLVCLKLLDMFRSDFLCICAAEGRGKLHLEHWSGVSCDTVAGEVSPWLRKALTVLAIRPHHPHDGSKPSPVPEDPEHSSEPPQEPDMYVIHIHAGKTST